MKKEAGRENKKTNLRTNWRSTGHKSRNADQTQGANAGLGEQTLMT